MERSGTSSSGAYAARAATSASGADRRGRSRDRDPSSSFNSSFFNGSRSSANVNTSRIKATHPQPRKVQHVADPTYTANATYMGNTERDSREKDAVLNSQMQLEPRKREIMMQLLVQITNFVARKQQLSKRHREATSSSVASTTPDWRKDFHRSRYDERAQDQQRGDNNSKDLFGVVIEICEDRMQRLSDTAGAHPYSHQNGRDDWIYKPPCVLVAEAMVQGLLVSLMEIQMNEKEEMVLDEVDTIEIMRQLHAQLEQDEQVVRHRVCAAAGDEQQLQELQTMLRTDFLQEVTHTRATQRLNDSAQSSDASLQFAWETIQEQKKEVVRLRAENHELKSRKSVLRDSSPSSQLLESSIFNDSEPVNAINLLRSQLSSHHATNLNILHDYIMRLEDALRRATSAPGGSTDQSRRDARDVSGITFDSSRGEKKENWRPFFSGSVGMRADDFSRTQPADGRRSTALSASCDQCKRTSGSLISLQSEVKQLRAQVVADEESLVGAEKDQLHLKRENSALTSELLSAKQQQEDLRQMILDITHEKHELQSQSELDQRASERTIRLSRDQLDRLDERNRHQARKLEHLELELGGEVEKRQRSSKASKFSSASVNDYDQVNEINIVLRERVSRLQSEIEEFEAHARENKRKIDELHLTLEKLRRESKLQHDASRKVENTLKLQEKHEKIASMKEKIDSFQQQQADLESQLSQFQRALSEKNQQLCERDGVITELKQDKKLLVSLQKMERERSLLHQDELEQAKEECAFLKERLSAAISDCEELNEAIRVEKSRSETMKKRFDEADFALKKQNDAVIRLKQEIKDADIRKQSLEDHVSAQLQLQKEIDKFKTSSHAVELQSEELQSPNARLSQEIADAKTTILMWMSKYNALSEQAKRLEEDAQCFSEERYSLQRQIEVMGANHSKELRDAELTTKANTAKMVSSLQETAKAELSQAIQSLTNQFEAKIAALDKLHRGEQERSQSFQSQLLVVQEKAKAELDQTRMLAAQFETKVAELEKQHRDQLEQTQSLQSDLGRLKNQSPEELHQLRESTLDLETQVSILNDANRKLQYELRSEERQRKTLGFLVQTLQERPILQCRAFQEMLLSSQRQLEFTFMQLSNRVERTGQKLLSAELKCATLKGQLCRRRLDQHLEMSVNNSCSNDAKSDIVESSSLTLHSHAQEETDGSLVVSGRYHGLCRMIQKLAATFQSEELLCLLQGERDEDFIKFAESVLVRALRILENQEQQIPSILTADKVTEFAITPSLALPSSATALPRSTQQKEDFVRSSSLAIYPSGAAASSSHEARCSSQVATGTREVLLSSTRTTRGRTERSTIYLKWRFMIVATLLKQQLAQKHLAYTRMVTKWMNKAAEKSTYEKQVKRWKWKCLALGATVKSSQRARSSASTAQRQVGKWQLLKHRLEKQQLRKTVLFVQLQALCQQKSYQQLQKLCVFTSWRYESKIQKLETEVSSLKKLTKKQSQQQRPSSPSAFAASFVSSSLSPVSAVALGNCVRLLQKFCEDTDTPVEIGASRETLTKYLIESNSKVASWRRTIDRKSEEFSDRKEQLVRLHDRYNEMKELVALHQQLVEEAERKAASQQAIVDAACNFTRAYKTLRSSVSSQMLTTNEFYAACKRVVEAVHASSRLQSVRSGLEVSTGNNRSSAASTTATSTTHTSRLAARLPTLDEQSEFSASRIAVEAFASSSAPSSAAVLPPDSDETKSDGTSILHHHDEHEQSRRRRRKVVNDSNIAMLESAVGSLRSANEMRVILDSALAEKSKLLEKAEKQLETKCMQFVVLRSFLRWKCSTYALRLQEAYAQRGQLSKE